MSAADDPLIAEWAKLTLETRTALGLSQPEFARRLGVVAQTISRWERGEVLPQAEQRKKLTELHALTVAEIEASA